MSAASNGHTEVVTALLGKSDSESAGCALEAAAIKGQIDVVDQLRGHCDEASISSALESAEEMGHSEVARANCQSVVNIVSGNRVSGWHSVLNLSKMNNPELLLIVCRVLPAELQAIAHIPELINNFLIPATVDSAVYNDLMGVIHVYGYSRSWTVAAMDGAAARGRLDILQWLHDNRSEGCSTTAFLGAAAHDHLDVLRWLHQYYPNLGDSQKELEVAAKCGHVRVVRFLLPGGSATEIEMCLVAAAENGHAQMMDAIYPVPVDMTKCFIAAATKNQIEVLQFLLEKGYRDQIRHVGPALKTAAAVGHVDATRLLLDICEGFSIASTLGTAVKNGQTAVVELILRRCSPDEFAIGLELKKAAQANRCDIVQLLLAKCRQSCSKRTEAIQAAIDIAFLDAIKHSRVGIVRLLADSSTFTVSDALRHAERGKQWEVVKLLLDFPTSREDMSLTS
ncbi:hypothetical protein ON010_g14304 [Phytophthora cinnamomi]|nr:hypothetical protein ON010_g14304 [Phytophthora cinnamomi]